MRVTDEYVFFWQEYFSNWAYAQGGLKIKIGKEEHTVPTSEHLFMIFKAQYFKDDETVQKMLEAKTPKDVKALGRQVKGFVPEKWDAVSSRYMTKAVTMRYEQDKKFAKMLTDKKYEGKTFVEASPYDKIWGIGMKEDDPDVEDKSKWQGQNKLGKCLTALRDKAVAVSLKTVMNPSSQDVLFFMKCGKDNKIVGTHMSPYYLSVIRLFLVIYYFHERS